MKNRQTKAKEFRPDTRKRIFTRDGGMHLLCCGQMAGK